MPRSMSVAQITSLTFTRPVEKTDVILTHPKDVVECVVTL
jgi:hypothetical protein